MRLDTKGAAAPALAGLLSVTGTLHFLVPSVFDAIVPPVLPGSPRTWVLASGGAELACAAAVACSRSRRVGAALAAILFIAVFPANVQMALEWRRQSTLRAIVAIVRLPLQVPLVWWALRVRQLAAAPAVHGSTGPAT